VRWLEESGKVRMAANVVEKESSKVKSGGLQVSLAGLMVLVLAAGLAAGAVRSAREVWGLRTSPTAPVAPVRSWGSPEVPAYRTAGVILEVAAVFLLVSLARNLVSLFRSQSCVDERERQIRWWGAAWRVGAVCFLLWFIAEESKVLRIDFRRRIEISLMVSGWDSSYVVQEQLLPVCGLFAILGLVLGMGASFMVPSARRSGSRPYWLFVVLAAVAAVLSVSLNAAGAMIVHFILVVLDFVTDAMQHHLNPGRGLWTRLLRAGVDAAISAGLCLGLALALARDFETLRRGKPWSTSRVGRALRLLLLAGSAGAGTYVAAVTFPAIHPCFAAGFRSVLGPLEAGMIVCCFGLFGAGLAARAIAGVPSQKPSLWIARISVFYRLSTVGVIVFAVLKVLPDPLLLQPYLPSFAIASIEVIQAGVAHFWQQFPDWFTEGALRMLAFENLFWTMLILATICFVIELLVRDRSPFTTPFDRLAESAARARGFVWLVFGFVVVCLAAIPTLIVLSQVLLLLRHVGGEMMSHGWAN
jgi:hypothetical protein